MFLVLLLRHQMRLIRGRQKTRKKFYRTRYIHKSVETYVSRVGVFRLFFYFQKCTFQTGTLVSNVILIGLIYFKFSKKQISSQKFYRVTQQLFTVTIFSYILRDNISWHFLFSTVKLCQNILRSSHIFQDLNVRGFLI